MFTSCPRVLRALVVVCLLAGSAVAAPINIDTFDLGSAQSAVFGVGYTTGGEVIGDPSQTIGGIRYYMAEGQGPGTGVTTLAVLGGRVGLGTLSIIAPYSGKWNLGYGFTLNGADADLNADLVGTGTPNTSLLINMASAEYDYALHVNAVTNGVGSTIIIPGAANLNPHDVFVPFSGFSGVNFQDVDQIVVTLFGRPDGDYAIDAIVAVPEPMTMVLLAMGGLVALRRRQAR
jgi:hypothetical protein